MQHDYLAGLVTSPVDEGLICTACIWSFLIPDKTATCHYYRCNVEDGIQNTQFMLYSYYVILLLLEKGNVQVKGLELWPTPLTGWLVSNRGNLGGIAVFEVLAAMNSK